MVPKRRLTHLVAGLMSVSLLAAGCGHSDSNADPDEVTTTTAAAEAGPDLDVRAGPTGTGAATLRSQLTSLLQEHVYLAGTAVFVAVNTPENFTLAEEALDANTRDLASAVEAIYGADAGDAFLELWRTHVAWFVDYATARGEGDQATQDELRVKQDEYRLEFGAFLASANPAVEPELIASTLEPHVESIFAAIDGVVDGSPDALTTLREAASHMPGVALVLSASFADQFPEEFPGDVGSPASSIRAGLTSLLNEHVYLAGFAFYTAVNAPDAYDSAVAELSANSRGLALAIGSVYGEDAADAFLPLWEEHIGFFVDYTTARAAGDEAGQAEAEAALDGYLDEFGAFLAGANPNLTKEGVVAELEPHASTVLATIDAVVDGDPEAFDRLREAAGHMPHTAQTLAAAISAQYPDRYGDGQIGEDPASGEEPAEQGPDGDIEAELFLFRPGTVSVEAGTEVVWVNRDQTEHLVGSGDPEAPTGEFGASLPGAGSTYGFLFAEPGRYPYFCEIHHHMRGVVEVTEAG